MVLVFASFATNPGLDLKLFGVALAIAVLLDAPARVPALEGAT